MTAFDTRTPRIAHVTRTSPLMVTVDSFSETHEFGPCPLVCSSFIAPPGGGLCSPVGPGIGDQVLALFPIDDTDHPWILQEAP